MRRGPVGGYDFGHKRQYRRTIWSTFRSFTNVQTSESHALLMPSTEGDEIEVALANGFREDRLHVVDMNPAIVATLKRRFPLISTYGRRLSSALARLDLNEVRLTVANFDFTNKLSDVLAKELVLCGTSDCFQAESYVALTIMKGREDSRYFNAPAGIKNWKPSERELSLMRLSGISIDHAALDRLSSEDRSRIREVEYLLSMGNAAAWVTIKAGTYQSSQPMLWMVCYRASYEQLLWPLVKDQPEHPAHKQIKADALLGIFYRAMAHSAAGRHFELKLNPSGTEYVPFFKGQMVWECRRVVGALRFGLIDLETEVGALLWNGKWSGDNSMPDHLDEIEIRIPNGQEML